MKQLRPYQQAAIDSLFDYIARNPSKNPLVVAPVGAGKSLMMADIIKRIHEQAPRVRIVVLAHVKELLQQNAAELASHYRGVDYGFYCAGLGQKRLHNDITFASIQSVHDKLLRFNRVPQVLIVDECHLIPTNDATTYRRFIDECKKANPNLVVIGLTGTPFRADSGRLDEGEGRLFDGVAYEIDIRWMIEQGYLCRPATPKMATQLSTDGVGTRAGDYIASQLEKAVDIDATTQACVDELMQHAAGRKKWLVFTAGIEHCTHVRDAIRARGVVAEMLTGDTPKVEREAIIARYKRGEIRALVNVAVLTTGFNVPDIDCLVFMRPTRSPVLYVQCIGRGIRPVYANGHNLGTQQGRLDAIAASGKPDCLLLDFGGVVNELGPVDAIEVRKRPGGGGKDEGEPLEAAPFKRCPSCGNLCAPAQRYCFNCSYSFMSDKLSQRASEKAVISTDSEPEDYQVLSISVKRHLKREDADRELEGLPPLNPATLKVTYATMAGAFHEWVCFEHHTYEVGDSRRFAWDKAVAWHKQRIPDLRPPITVKEALAMGYPNYAPFSIKVRKEGKYNRIIGYDFSRPAQVDSPPSASEWGDTIPF